MRSGSNSIFSWRKDRRIDEGDSMMNRNKIGALVTVMALTSMVTTNAAAQYNLHNNYHVGFDRPEAWGLKYFASSTMLSGLTPPESEEDRRLGSVTLGFEIGWLPTLDAGQRRIGFNGTAPEDLNMAPIFARPVLRIGLPDKFTGIVAGPPPLREFGVTPHLIAF